MANYEDYFVAFIDILGFKRHLDSLSCDSVKSIFDDISIFREIKENPDMVYYIMSDSIIIAALSNQPNSFNNLCIDCLMLQIGLLYNDPPIFVRGAISKGGLYYSQKDNVIFGKGLSSVYELQEHNALNPRIRIPFDVYYEGINNENNPKVGSAANSMLTDDDDYKFLDYMGFLGNVDPEIKARIREHIIYTINHENNLNIRSKYLWLKKYYNRVYQDRIYFKEIGSN